MPIEYGCFHLLNLGVFTIYFLHILLYISYLNKPKSTINITRRPAAHLSALTYCTSVKFGRLNACG